jgi:vacuolar-type H+-ATPase subunit E/Vma4
VRSLSEQIEDANIQDCDELSSVKEDIQSELENLRDETQESLDNMPDSLQYSPTGELLQERIDAVESAVDEVECIDAEYDEDEPDLDDFREDPEDCLDCDGTGKDDEEDCQTCKGEGTVENDGQEEFDIAQNEWQDGLNTYVEEKVSDMQEAVSSCEV